MDPNKSDISFKSLRASGLGMLASLVASWQEDHK